MTESFKTKNERRSKRMQVDYLLKFRPDGDASEEMLSNVRDISSTGVRFVSYRFLPEGTHLQMSICIPPLERAIECVGRVVHVRQSADQFYLISAHFISIQPAQQSLLNEFIERISKQPKAKTVIDHRDTVVRRFAVRSSAT